MKEPATLADLTRMIDSLYATTGLRLNVVDRMPMTTASMSNIQQLCDFVAEQLQLPVRVIVDRTSQLVNAGAPAEVEIPGNLPEYSSPALRGFEVRIRVAEVYEDPYHMATLLSHEFAHIYLYSRRDPLRESEHATDLCSLMMGFGPVWTKGRTNMRKEHRGWLQKSVLYYHTLGYLTDEQYEHASKYIDQLRAGIGSKRVPIIKAIGRLRALTQQLYAQLAQAPAEGYAAQMREYVASATERINQLVRSFNAKRTFREQDKRWLDDCAAWLTAAEAKLTAARQRVAQSQK